MAVLLKSGQPVARLSASLPSGTWVRAAYSTVPEEIDASRDDNLLNAFDAKVSNAKKWDGEEYVSLPTATAINGGDSEFVIR